MGAEHSKRNLHSSDLLVPHLMNNQEPLKFNTVHGDNVRLGVGGAVASRDEGFCKGIVFSHRPVAINEHIYVKFSELSTCWSGGLRIGFTSTDPATMKQKLPKYACPCLSNLPGNWARALPERIVQKDSVLFYYVNQKGEVYFGLDDVEKGIFFNGVATTGKLWAMMDIYGNTIRIELLDEHNFLGNVKRRAATHDDLCLVEPRSNFPISSFQSHLWGNLVPMYFHSLHGKHVTLNEERMCAEKNTLHPGHGYVFAEQAMKAADCTVLEVMSDCDTNDESSIVIGLTSCNPNCLSQSNLPDDPNDFFDRPEYWVVTSVNESAKREDIFMFRISNDGELQYSKNGCPFITIVYVDHTLDLWFFVNLNQFISKITLEGVFHDLSDQNTSELIGNFRMQSMGALSSRNETQNTRGGAGPTPQSEAPNECVICCEASINCALYRCGHVCLCYECGKELLRRPEASCPICREEIQDVIKIYK